MQNIWGSGPNACSCLIKFRKKIDSRYDAVLVVVRMQEDVVDCKRRENEDEWPCAVVHHCLV